MAAALFIGIPLAGLIVAALFELHDRRRHAQRLWDLDHPAWRERPVDDGSRK